MRTRLLGLALLAGVLVSACGDDAAPSGGGSGGCAADADCAGGRCGPAGACVECLDASDCGGRLCVDGSCASCTADADCGGGRCDAVTGACVGCLADADCTAPAICRDDGTCGNECASDADCADHPGTFCDLGGVNGAAPSFRCIEPQNPTCQADGDCAPNEACLGGECRCASDAACAPGEACVDNDCVPAATCAADGDCPQGRVCEEVEGVLTCVEACAQDSDCGAFGVVCRAGHCEQQCAGDATCLEDGTICENNTCVPAECATLAECDAGELCTSARHGRCEPFTPCTSDGDCADANFRCGDPAPCPPGFDCGATDICVERDPCVTDNDCEGEAQYCQDFHCRDGAPCASRAECRGDEDCVAGLCVPFVCRGDEDCDAGAGELCVAGACAQPPAADAVTEVRILTVPRPLSPGEQVRLVAIALTASGQGVPGQTFEWSSSEAAVADVDASGLLAAASAGATDVTARLTAPGNRVVVSQPVTFRVFDPVPAGDACAVAFDTGSGAPLAGATVVLDGVEATTDADGRACWGGGAAATHDVQLYADGYDRVALVAAPGDDLAVASRRSLGARAAGYTGTISFAQVTSQGGLDVGLAGASRDELLGLGLASLLGDVFVQHLQTPLGGFDAPVPGGMTLNLTAPFPISIKDEVFVSSEPGLRAVWSFAGRMDAGNLGIGGGGAPSAGQVIARTLPYFGTFEHGLQSEILVDLAKVADAADVDGDGDVTEKLPDYRNPAFPALNLRPATQQNLRVEIDVPNLPSLGGEPLTTAVLLTAAKVPQLGYTPLGLSAATDEDGDTAIDPQVMKLAPLYSGLEAGGYATAAMAIRVPEGGGANVELPPEVSARILSSDYLPALAGFAEDAFLPFAEGAQWDRPTRSLGLDAADAAALGAAGADVIRVIIEGDLGRWVVYLPVDAAGGTLPLPPAAFAGGDPADPAQTLAVWIEPISVVPGVGWDDLASVGGATVGDLDTLADGYSRLPLP